MGKLRWALGAVLVAALLVVGGTWVYINVIRADPPQRLDTAFDQDAEPDDAVDAEPGAAEPGAPRDPGTTTSGETGDTLDSVEGTWAPTPRSLAGYRVGEVLFGQTAEGVGRTNQVRGHLTISGTTVTEAAFEVDMASVESDDSRRDNQFRGRIMDVANHPTATLVLTEPIELGQIPAELEVIDVNATVELTLRGVTRVLPLDLQARLNGQVMEISGALTIVFEEWGIPNPSTMGITTEDEGELEFLLVLASA